MADGIVPKTEMHTLALEGVMTEGSLHSSVTEEPGLAEGEGCKQIFLYMERTSANWWFLLHILT